MSRSLRYVFVGELCNVEALRARSELLPIATKGSTWPILLIVRHDKHIEIMMEDRARKGRAVVIVQALRPRRKGSSRSRRVCLLHF